MDNNPTILNINLFPNDGLKKGDQGPPICFSLVTTPDGQQVQVTAADFMAGWQGNIPPFSNNDLSLRDMATLQKGITYEVAGWANNDVKDEDATWRKLLISRNGRTMLPRENEGAPVGNRKTIRYLNISVKVRTFKQINDPQPQAVASGNFNL